MIRDLLRNLPPSWAIWVAWSIVIIPILAPLALVGTLALPVIARTTELAETRQQVSLLAERVAAGESEFRAWHEGLARTPGEVTEYFDRGRSREAFEAAYDSFLDAAEMSTIRTRQAGTVRELPVSDNVGDFQALWVGRGSPEAVFELLLDQQESPLRIASFTLRSTDAQGMVEVDAVIEFRKSFFLDGATD